MNKKVFALLGFSLLFLAVISLGCSFLGGGGGKGNGVVNESAGEISKGPINASVLIDGKAGLSVDLVSRQRTQIGINIRNAGTQKMEKVSATLIGCLKNVTKTLHYEDALEPNERRYFSWDMESLELSSSENIRCYETVRLCYETVSKAYSDLALVPENYQEAPPEPGSSYLSDVLVPTFNFGVIRVLCNADSTGQCTASADANTVTGSITIRNTAPGWVGYINYTSAENKNLTINMLKKVEIETSNDTLKIIKAGELGESNLRNWRISGKQNTLLFDANNADIVKDYQYLLKLVGGKELYLSMSLNVTNPDYYQSTPRIERINTTITHGYCLDIATINVNMVGR